MTVSEQLYEGKAAYYDSLYQDKDYEGEVDFVIGRFEEYAETDGRKVLVVGCGTGNHSAQLVDEGFEVTGIDPSAEMLEIARQKSDARFEEGSLPDISVDGEFDLVLLPFTVVNHLPREDLAASFENVKEIMADGALLIFDTGHFFIEEGEDVNTPFIETAEHEGDDIARISQMQRVEGEHLRFQSVVMVPEGFFVDSHDIWDYTDEDMEEILSEGGFEFERYEGGYGTESSKDHGTVFVCWRE